MRLRRRFSQHGNGNMELWKSIVLGAIQGVTEFLPVSSSGHLVIAKSLFGFQQGQGPLWEVAVHFGTLVAILCVFYREILALARSALRVAAGVLHGRPRHELLESEPRFTVLMALVIGTLPAGVVGLLFKDAIESLFDSPILASCGLIATGVMLAFTARVPRPRKDPVGLLDGFLIGCAQAVAIIPGISRSGSTISAALARRVDRAEAGRFSFLLALPALGGAALLEARKIEGIARSESLSLLAAVVSAFLVGLVALKLLMRLVKAGRLSWFAFYCIPAGVISLCYFALMGAG